MKRFWWILALVLVLLAVLTWWFPALFLALLPHEAAFVLGLLGFSVLAMPLIAEMAWGLALFHALRRGRLSREQAQARLESRYTPAAGLAWAVAWHGWWLALRPQRMLLYSLFWLVALALMVLHLSLHPLVVDELLPLLQGFFWGAAVVTFLTWALEWSLQDALDEFIAQAAQR